jgi:hypothetical protein
MNTSGQRMPYAYHASLFPADMYLRTEASQEFMGHKLGFTFDFDNVPNISHCLF